MTEHPNPGDSFFYGAQLTLLNDMVHFLELTRFKLVPGLFIAPFWQHRDFNASGSGKAGHFLLKLCKDSDRKKIKHVLDSLEIPCSIENGTLEEKYFGIAISANDIHVLTPELAHCAESLVYRTELLAALNRTAWASHLSGIDPEHSTPRWKLKHSVQSGSNPYAILQAYDDYALGAYSDLLITGGIDHDYRPGRHGLAKLHLSRDEFDRLSLDKIQFIIDLQKRNAEQTNAVGPLVDIAPRNWDYGFRQSQPEI